MTTPTPSVAVKPKSIKEVFGAVRNTIFNSITAVDNLVSSANDLTQAVNYITSSIVEAERIDSLTVKAEQEEELRKVLLLIKSEAKEA
jgi:hypothetical protein